MPLVNSSKAPSKICRHQLRITLSFSGALMRLMYCRSEPPVTRSVMKQTCPPRQGKAAKMAPRAAGKRV